MKSKERVNAVLAGEKPDKTPIMHTSFSSRVASAILGRPDAHVGGGIQQWHEAAALWNGPDAHAEFIERSFRDAVDVALACNHDVIRPYHWRDKRKPAAKIDEYTFRHERPDGSWEVLQFDPPTELYNRIDGSPEAPAVYDDLEAEVEADEASADSYVPSQEQHYDVLRALREYGEEYEIRVPGTFLGIPPADSRWLEATLLRPDLVERLLDTQVCRAIKNIDFFAPHGARVFFGGNDLAGEDGPMFSPKVFREILVPRLRPISDHCHTHGCYSLFGTDGNVWPFGDDLYVATGIDGHYEFDRKAGMDILKLNQAYPHITMFGNITSHLLHMGSPEDVIAQTRACVEEAHATNKVVVGCSNIIITETPMKNVDAMLETIEKYR